MQQNPSPAGPRQKPFYSWVRSSRQTLASCWGPCVDNKQSSATFRYRASTLSHPRPNINAGWSPDIRGLPCKGSQGCWERPRCKPCELRTCLNVRLDDEDRTLHLRPLTLPIPAMSLASVITRHQWNTGKKWRAWRHPLYAGREGREAKSWRQNRSQEKAIQPPRFLPST